MTEAVTNVKMTHEALQDLVVESDTGARRPVGITAKILIAVAFFWSLFQLWIASPFPFVLSEHFHFSVLDGTKARYIHLAFALFLAYFSYPASKRAPKKKIPRLDIICAGLGVFTTLYLLIFADELAYRVGIPTQMDIVVAAIGMVLLLEATRRALGLPLMVVAIVFLLYTFLGSMDFIPDVIRHKGQSLNKVATHMWLTTEGVFGVALGVSTSFVFLFVLFGALLDKAGAGNYFIKLAVALLGHMRGGPAKASVLASGLTGIISGSSIANVVTTGTFTIPLMRRVGFTREQAGAIEVAAGIDGQIMPPVMGAAAFLMVEYVGIPYTDIIKHAFLPAVLSYLALLYMVHLEAVKHNMMVIPRAKKQTVYQSFLSLGITLASIIILAGLVYFIVGGIKALFPETALFVVIACILIAYTSLLKFQSKHLDLELDDPTVPLKELPEVGATLKTGLHYILPVVVLIWCLMIERLSAGLSAFYAVAFLMFILVTQHPIKEFFRKTGKVKEGFRQGLHDLFDGLIAGARNMVGIGVATACAGIIVGVVSLTGIGQVLTEVVEMLSGGSVILMLVYTALISLILGMGLPTTANYIVVASLMAKVIQDLGAQNGLIVPAIAIHMFVFYFGIMADVTPPVGLASFAASAISGGDPIRTGLQGSLYSLRTAILPFFFIFDPELLLIGVHNFWLAFWIFLKALIALMMFSSALQGYFLVRNKKYESALLLLSMTMYFAPQMWMDWMVKPFEFGEVSKFEQIIEQHPVDDIVKIHVTNYDFDGIKQQEKVLYMPIKKGKNSAERLEKYGLILRQENDKLIVDDVRFNSAAEKALDAGNSFYDYDHVITGIEVSREQPSKRWMNIPATLLLMSVVLLQWRRRKKLKVSMASV